MLVASELSVAPAGARAPVVQGISLALAPGECLAILGPNGSGKSTLALALAGLLAARAGRVTFEGLAIGPHEPPARRAGIAALLQDPSHQLLQPTVAEEAAFAARNLGAPDADAHGLAWLERLGIAALAWRDPRLLSAGQQQLVLLAAALAARPRLLVADEPLSHVDAGRRTLALAALEERRRAGLAIVWVGGHEAATHTLALGRDTAPGPPRAARTEGTAAALVLRVSPARAAGDSCGPHVATDESLEIEIAERGVTALLGPNGSGKSVLLSCAAGLVSIPQVEVRWVGSPVQPPVLSPQYPEEQIFEERAGDELVYGAIARGVPRGRAEAQAHDTLSAAGLAPETWDRRTWTLSGGEKRWLAAAATLLTPAGLVLLDEPTAGLDPARREALAGLILRFCSEVPVVIATQDRAFAERLGARCRELPGRSIIVPGTPSPSKKTD
ncbi:MAG TPA: ATP-binding cassette domain-containing protein [Candidatus Eisenbacteria bacterium]|nr:ATP-binding cassette domain-containing protein [Candidatus Eisenbacteria bacterium]